MGQQGEFDGVIQPDTVALLARASTATIQSQLFRRGLRNTFLYGLAPINPRAGGFVGEAFTLRYIPAREDLDVMEIFDDPAHPQRLAIEKVAAGQVLVMDCRQNPRAASGGNILATRLMMRGVAAMVTDGSVRDSPALGATPFPVYCAGISATVNLALHHAVDMGVPIGCAGVPVYPGDVLAGDPEGVVVIPRHLAAEVATAAADQERMEKFILERIRSGAPLQGTYPPNETTRAEFLKAVDSGLPAGTRLTSQ